MIPESQLEVWAGQGAVTTSAATRASIYNALTGPSSKLKDRNMDVYLQGSYGNDTNIRGNSDVDVVVQLNAVYYYDISGLSAPEQAAFKNTHPAAGYDFFNFHADVLEVLTAYYGSVSIEVGNKSIKVAPAEGQRLPADAVPCCLHKTYLRYPDASPADVVEGMKFFTRDERRGVVNYPKLHRDNGAAKNSESQANGWYKPTVRMLKNARRYLVEAGSLERALAPSYFLECLVSNVPNKCFGPSYQETYKKVVVWAATEAAWDRLLCQNGIIPLIGSSPEQWKTTDAKAVVTALANLWNDWYE